MDLLLTIFKGIVLGFFGLIGLLFLLAILFGKRVIKRWEYEAEFRDASGREFGEFEIELSRIAKQEDEDTIKASFKLRHASIGAGQRVQVLLDEVPVLEGSAETAGRIYLSDDHRVNTPENVAAGQRCEVVYGGKVQFSAELVPD